MQSTLQTKLSQAKFGLAQTFSVAKEKTGVAGRIRQFAKARFDRPHLQQMAEASGINYTQLSNYGDTNLPGTDTLMKLRSIGMSIDWLLTGEGDMLITSESAGSGDFRLVDIRDTETVMEMLTEYMARQKAKERDE